MPKTLPRPPALTIACVFLGVASVLLLGSLVSILGSWTSLDTQESIRGAFDDALLSDVGVTIETAVRWARWILIGFVPVAVAGIVFAIYAVRGHRASRWFLTALCALGFFFLAAAGIAGIFPALMFAFCAATIWSRESRAWYAAVNAAPAAPTATGASTTAAPVVSNAPPPAPVPAPGPWAGPAPTVVRRPRPVEIAVWTTITASAVVALGSAMILLMTTVGADVYRESLQESAMMRDLLDDAGVTIDTVIEVGRWVSAAALVLALVGLAAGLATLFTPRALTFLQVMAGLTIGVSLVSLPLGNLFAVLTGPAAVVVLVQAVKPEARAWGKLS